MYAGPEIALRTSCELQGENGGVIEKINCDDFSSQGLKFKVADGADNKRRVISLVATLELPWGK